MKVRYKGDPWSWARRSHFLNRRLLPLNRNYSQLAWIFFFLWNRRIMSSDTDKIRSKLSILEASLDDLELKLEPLLSQTFAESAVGLETAQQAKLQVVLPYLVYDLVFSMFSTNYEVYGVCSLMSLTSLPENTRNWPQDTPSFHRVGVCQCESYLCLVSQLFFRIELDNISTR